MTDHPTFPFEQLRSNALARSTNIAILQQLRPLLDGLQSRHRGLKDAPDSFDVLAELLNKDYNNVNATGKHMRGAAYLEALGIVLDALEEERGISKARQASPTQLFKPTHGLTHAGEIPLGDEDVFKPDEYYIFKRATHGVDNYGTENARANLLRYASNKYSGGQVYGTPVTMPTPQGDITVRVEQKANHRRLFILGNSVETLNDYIADLRIEHAADNPQAAGLLR